MKCVTKSQCGFHRLHENEYIFTKVGLQERIRNLQLKDITKKQKHL